MCGFPTSTLHSCHMGASVLVCSMNYFKQCIFSPYLQPHAKHPVTCMSTENDVKRADALLADLPLWKQWRKLWLFVIMQALIVAATTLFLQFFSTVAFEACPGADSDCRMPGDEAMQKLTGCKAILPPVLYKAQTVRLAVHACWPEQEYLVGDPSFIPNVRS